MKTYDSLMDEKGIQDLVCAIKKNEISPEKSADEILLFVGLDGKEYQKKISILYGNGKVKVVEGELEETSVNDFFYELDELQYEILSRVGTVVEKSLLSMLDKIRLG